MMYYNDDKPWNRFIITAGIDVLSIDMYQLIEAEWQIVASENGLSPVRRQTIILTNVGSSSIGPQGTYFIEILFAN